MLCAVMWTVPRQKAPGLWGSWGDLQPILRSPCWGSRGCMYPVGGAAPFSNVHKGTLWASKVLQKDWVRDLQNKKEVVSRKE